MRTLICLLVSLSVSAQDPLPLRERVPDLKKSLGSDPTSRIQLTPPGCWDELIQGVLQHPAPRTPPRAGEASVEVWGLLPPSSPRHEAFSLYLETLRRNLSRALETPPPSHQAIELSEIMLSDPSHPEQLDLTKVKSMQERFNRLPPNGSPVK